MLDSVKSVQEKLRKRKMQLPPPASESSQIGSNGLIERNKKTPQGLGSAVRRSLGWSIKEKEKEQFSNGTSTPPPGYHESENEENTKNGNVQGKEIFKGS